MRAIGSYVEAMAVHHVVRISLRQSSIQHIEVLTAVACTRGKHAAIDRHALLIAHKRHEPRGVRIARMDHDSESKIGWTRCGDLAPVRTAIGRLPDTAVMLSPQHIGIRFALNDAVRILNHRIQLPFGWHECRTHAMAHSPGVTAVPRSPGTAAGDSDHNVVRVFWMHADRMDSRNVVATAHPLFALRHVP